MVLSYCYNASNCGTIAVVYWVCYIKKKSVIDGHDMIKDNTVVV